MANTFHGGGSQSPTSISKPIEKVFEDAQHTGEILLSCRKLREYPKLAGKYDLVDTISADISRNRLSEVPKELCSYLSMEKIQCYHNVIKSIPEAIVQLQALTYLNLSRNQLTIIPSFISQLQTLEVLIAGHNRLVSLPEEIGVLDKLMELDVSCNEISHLPIQIGDLKSLKSLNVRRNLLEILPVEISKLNLRKLDISGNRISKIPTVFRRIETLEEIVLHDNPLTMPPAHVCTKGKQHIMKYLQIVANREAKQLGLLNEAEMKRFRKSLPPQQSVSSEEFRNLVESPDKWKRHTVLSSDSGYSTTDSIDKISWSPQETNSEPQHLVNGLSHTTHPMPVGMMPDPRLMQDREVKREPPPPPPQRVNSRLSPEKFTPPSSLPAKPAQIRSPPTPPTLFPNSPQTPLTPPTPQGPGPGPGGAVTPGKSPILGTSLEDEFTRELQRQKSDYENKKKLAEQIRIQKEEEEEKEQRRRAAQRIQDEQRLMLERQREETRMMEEKKAWEEARQREVEEAKRQEEMRLAEEARKAEEFKKAEEARRREEERVQLEAKQHRVENNYYLNNHHGYRHNTASPAWPPPPSPSLIQQHDQYSPRSPTYNEQTQYGQRLSHTSQVTGSYSQYSPRTPPHTAQSPVSPGHGLSRQAGQISPGCYGQTSAPIPGQHQYSGQQMTQNSFNPVYHNSNKMNSGQLEQSGQMSGHLNYSQYHDRSYDSLPRGQHSSDLHARLNPNTDQMGDQSPSDRRNDPNSPDYGRNDQQYGHQYGQTNSMGHDPYSGYRKPALSASNSFKEERRPGSSTPYRRTTSDSNQRLPAHTQHTGSQHQTNANANAIITNGPILEQPNVNGTGSRTPTSSTSPSVSSNQTSRPGPVSNGPTADRPTTPQGTVTRKPKSTDKAPVSTSRVAKPTEKHGRATTATSTRTGVPTARKSNLNQDEELRKSTQSLKGSSDGTTKIRGEQRLRTIQKEAVNNNVNRRSSGSTSSEDDRKRVTPTRTGLPSSTAASKRAGTGMSTTRTSTTASRPTTAKAGASSGPPGASTQARRARQNSTSSTTSVSSTASKSSVVDKSKRGGSVMTNAQVKMLEDYNKEAGSNFTMRRQHDNYRDHSEQMETLRKTISTRLKRTLPDSLSEALSDGVLLCHLANQIRPRSVASVHVPSPAVPKLTPAKCRRNVENFLEACRKIGVSKDQICGASDILEEKGLNRVAMTVAALVAIATHPRHPPATNDQICGASDILEEKGLNRVAMTVAALVAIATHPRHPPATNV